MVEPATMLAGHQETRVRLIGWDGQRRFRQSPSMILASTIGSVLGIVCSTPISAGHRPFVGSNSRRRTRLGLVGLMPLLRSWGASMSRSFCLRAICSLRQHWARLC
jgi:hypothetical protein